MSDQIPEDLGTPECPECGEAIKAVAKKCRFCGTFFDADLEAKQRGDPNPPHKGDCSTGLIFLGVGVLVFVIFELFAGTTIPPGASRVLVIALPLGPLLVIAGVVAHFREQRRSGQ